MSESNPSNFHKIDSDPTEPKKIITPALVAIGRIYATTSIPISPEDASQVERLTHELFSSIKTGEPQFQERNMQIVRRYFGIDDGTKPSPAQMKKEFNLSSERIRTIAEKFRGQARRKALSDKRLNDLPNFLPFKEHQIGHSLFGKKIIKRDVKNGLPEGLMLKDINLTPQAIRRLEAFGHFPEENFLSLLSRGSNTASSEIVQELRIALERIIKKPASK